MCTGNGRPRTRPWSALLTDALADRQNGTMRPSDPQGFAARADVAALESTPLPIDSIITIVGGGTSS